MSSQLPTCPSVFRNIQSYLKTASEHDERDPVISYWCRLYALQSALAIDKKSDEAKAFLLPLMEWLEKTKRSLSTNESITGDTAAQAYVENYALKLFIWADNMDRAGTFNKNVVKSFYTSGLLMDVLTIFGELNEDIAKNRKYAKWKAAYIHNCLKNGEVPTPGPQNECDEENELNDLLKFDNTLETPSSTTPPSGRFLQSTATNATNNVSPDSAGTPSKSNNLESNSAHQSQPTSLMGSLHLVDDASNSISQSSQITGTIKLDASQIAKAQKYCKFASSALNYDDIPEAVMNLQKALKLLQNGNEE